MMPRFLIWATNETVVLFSELGVIGRRSSLEVEEINSIAGLQALAVSCTIFMELLIAICCVDLRVLKREGEQLYTWGL